MLQRSPETVPDIRNAGELLEWAMNDEGLELDFRRQPPAGGLSMGVTPLLPVSDLQRLTYGGFAEALHCVVLGA